jgi:hypothetical protein
MGGTGHKIEERRCSCRSIILIWNIINGKKLGENLNFLARESINPAYSLEYNVIILA